MIPDSWERRTIAELCEMVKGSSPISKTKEGQFPLVTTGAERKTADHYQFDAAAVCVPMISSTGHGHASLKRVHYQEGKFALANLLTALIVRDQTKLSPRFLHLYLNFYKDQLLVPLQAGAANMTITVGRLATVPVRFPPLAEQERILRTLDEADELRRLRGQADHRTADLIPAIFNKMFGDPVTNLKRLPVLPLGQLTQRITKGESPGWQGFEYCLEGPKFITSENVLWGELNHSSAKRIPQDFHDKLLRSALRPGDVLVNIVGASIGRCAIVPHDLGEANVNQAVAVLSPSDEMLPEYLASYLLSSHTQSALHKGKVDAARANISLSNLRNLPTLLPPLSIQKQFAARVAEVRLLEESQAASRNKLNDLFQSLLNSAFRGEL